MSGKATGSFKAINIRNGKYATVGAVDGMYSDDSSTAYSGTGPFGAGPCNYAPGYSPNGYHTINTNIAHTHTYSGTTNSSGEDEARPINSAMQIWRRVS